MVQFVIKAGMKELLKQESARKQLLRVLRIRTIGSLSVGMDFKTEMQKPFTLLVEGNIGSGKTSFLSHFSKYDSLILSEPVELWRNVQGHNMLVRKYHIVIG